MLQNNVVACYISLICGLYLILFSSYMFLNEINKYAFGLGLVFRESLYTFGIALYIAPILTGRLYLFGGWLKENLLIYISRVATTCLLISPILIKLIVINMKISYYHSTPTTLIWGLSFIGISILFSYILSALFEKPFLKLELYLFNSNKLK